MPLFDFICKTCGNEFEALVLGREKARCPQCQSHDLEKQMASFAVRTSDGSGGYSAGAGAKCTGCAGGSCKTCR